MLLALLSYAWAPALPDSSESPALRWEAPAECPDEAQLRARIVEFAPGVLAAPELSARVEARVDRVEGRYAASVRIENEDGISERRFTADDCALVSDAAALVIAVGLAPVTSVATVRAHERPEPEPEPDEPPEPEPPPDPGPEPESSPLASDELDEPPEPAPASLNLSLPVAADAPDPTRARFGLRVFAGGGYGPTNTGYGAVGGALALFSDRWRAELIGSWSIPRIVRRGEVGGTFDAWTVAARGCFVPGRGRLEFPLCPGVELGQVRGRGLDELPQVQDASFLWAALGIGQGLWFAAHERVALGLEVQAGVALRRGAFVVEDRQVQRLAPVGVRGLAGVELRLP